MKSFKLALAALALLAPALAGCGTQTSTHTVKVTGPPGEVARFVTAEKGRDGSADVTYRPGEGRAVFSVPTSDAQSGITGRATAARLSVETRSSSWTFTSNP